MRYKHFKKIILEFCHIIVCQDGMIQIHMNIFYRTKLKNINRIGDVHIILLVVFNRVLMICDEKHN